MRGGPRNKYIWYYTGNPLGPADAFLLQHRLDDAAAVETVGCCGAGIRRIHVRGRVHDAGLFADFAVDKAHRTVMPALMLQRALCAHVTSAHALGYGFPNAAAVGIFGRIGFPLLGQMGRYAKVLRYSHFLQRRVHRWTATTAGCALDIASGLRDRALGVDRNRRFAWTEDVDERFDALWEVARDRYPIIGERTSRFLRWRFVRRPGLGSSLATLTDGSGSLLAYAAVIEKEPGVALIADFLAATDDDLRTLLRRLTLALRSRGFNSAVTLFLGAPAVSHLLKAEGLRFRNLAKFVVVGAGQQGIEEQALRKTEDWYLTEADRDN